MRTWLQFINHMIEAETAQIPREALGGLALLLLAASLLRKRLAAGVGEALFLTGMVTAALAVYLPDLHGLWQVEVSVYLGAIVFMLFIAVHWIEEDRNAGGGAARRVLAQHCVLSTALLVAAISLSLPDTAPVVARTTLSVILIVLLTVTLFAASAWRPEPAALRMAILVTVGTMCWYWRDVIEVQALAPGLSWVAIGGGALSLAIVVGGVLLTRRHRRRVWLTEPSQLLEPRGPRAITVVTVDLLSVLIAVATVLNPGHPLMPVACWLGAFAAFGIGHRSTREAASEWGFALHALACVSATMAWLPSHRLAVSFGTLVAAWHCLWLAHFWHQQLDHGRAWTTAGRLIPTARRFGYGLVMLAFVGAMRGTLLAGSSGSDSLTIAIALLLACLITLRQLRVDAGTHHRAPAALLAGYVAIVLVANVRMSFFGTYAAAFPLLFAFVAVFLAVSWRRVDSRQRVAWGMNAYVGAILPTLTAIWCIVVMLPWHVGLAALVLILAAWLIRFRPGQRALPAALPQNAT